MANNFTTLIHEQGVYGMPETQSAFLLYYRKDVLQYLGLSVPDTWEDVVKMLPILQSHRLNFYHPLGGDSAYKGYGFTTPFIYQLGGEVYSENGVESALSNPKTIEALRFMTDLFTLYNLPLQVSSFFEHFRSGTLPIGIASIDMYLQLKYAAPELAGQWDVAPLPGTIDEETGDTLRYATSYGKASILFANSKMKSEGWDLIRWWTSAETQIRFQQIVKTSLGERYLQIPANMVALKASVWDESIKNEIYNQALWARLPAVTPASYIVERELSNVWNKVVIDKTNLMVAINSSTIRIERELRRKFAEFGYYAGVGTNGRLFVVPMNSNIEQWIPGGGYRHEDD
jgi:ABC-type glycerol-3-phosphate transport system substrate-binding protein